MFSTGITSLSALLLFHLPLPFHLTEMRFSQSTHLLMIIFGNFNVYHKDWLTYYGGTHRPSELK